MASSRTNAAPRVDLIRVLDLLQRHGTRAVCQTVFRRVRTTERQRVWTLEALVRFWTAVILRAPHAVSQALAEVVEGREPLVPQIVASPEAFFQRCRDLRPAFFAEVFRRVTASLVSDVPPRYAAPVAPVRARFADLLILDGSRLAAIAHRLTRLWDERAVVLPGCLLAVCDLGRGVCRALQFDANAAASELTRAKAALGDLAPDTVVMGDRLYGTATVFAALHARGCWGLFRRNRRLGLRKLRRLRTRRHEGGCLEDWRVAAGSGATAPVHTLRSIRWRRGRTRHEVLTSVVEPTRLAADEALALYPYRWRIERLFFDLKEVLTLNRLSAANPNAIAMQVYAAALVYNAMRVAQGEVAEAADIPPEEISPAKFSPTVAAACYTYLLAQQWERTVRRLNRGRPFRMLDWRRHRWARVTVAAVRVEHRTGRRRQRRYCAARRQGKSLAHVRGGRRLISKLT